MIKIAKSDIGKRVIGKVPNNGNVEIRHGELVGFSDNLPLVKYDELNIPRKAFADWLEWETK